jgi:hypothetical protein
MLTHVVHNKSGRTRVIAIVASLALLLCGGVTWAFWPKDPKDIIAQLDNDPRKIRQAVEDGKITRDDARDAMRERFEAEETKRVDEFFALPPGPQRDKYLDQQIDEMQRRMREWQERASTQPTSRPARDRDGPSTRPSDAERQRRMAERDDRTPPAQRAKRVEFRAAMMKRMQERGIQPPGGRWGGGTGGGRGGPGGGGRGPR